MARLSAAKIDKTTYLFSSKFPRLYKTIKFPKRINPAPIIFSITNGFLKIINPKTIKKIVENLSKIT